MPSPIGHQARHRWTTMWARAAATVCDYSLVGLWAGGVLAATLTLTDEPATLPPAVGQLRGFFTLTVPATLALAAAEHRGGTPGKRLLRLQTRTREGARLTMRRSLIRTTMKVAVPWELAHIGIWQSLDGTAGVSTVLPVAAAYLLLGAAAVALLSGRRPWYDLIVNANVRPR